jgi:hypothetical protein
MMDDVISRRFAEFVIHNLKNNNSYEDSGAFITEGIYNGIKVIVVENSDNLSGKISNIN